MADDFTQSSRMKHRMDKAKERLADWASSQCYHDWMDGKFGKLKSPSVERLRIGPVEKLHILDDILCELRRKYDIAALEDRFNDADVFAVQHEQMDVERQRLRWALRPEEVVRYEVERHERRRGLRSQITTLGCSQWSS